MKKKIGLAVLLMSGVALSDINEFKLKGASDGEFWDLGAEVQVQSINPLEYGVFGVDLDHKMIRFNMGYGWKMKGYDLMAFTGFGYRKYLKGETRVISGAKANNNACTNSNGHANGCSNNANNGGTSGTNVGINKNIQLGTVFIEDKELVHELGLRFTPQVEGKINPFIESQSLTTDGGSNFEHTFKIGIIFGI